MFYLEFLPVRIKALGGSHCVSAVQCPLDCGDAEECALVLEGTSPG